MPAITCPRCKHSAPVPGSPPGGRFRCARCGAACSLPASRRISGLRWLVPAALLLAGLGWAGAVYFPAGGGAQSAAAAAEEKSGGEKPAPAEGRSGGSESEKEKPFRGDPLNKPVLNKSNLTYLGSFRMPGSDHPAGQEGHSTAFTAGGLAHRYVNGKLRFFSTNHVYEGGQVYETDYPGLGKDKDAENLPQAKVVKYWGDVYQKHKWVGNDGGFSDLGNAVWTYGLFYDENLKRLYWNYGYWYNVDHPNNPSMGYSVLDDKTGKATGVGSWSLSKRPEKFDRGGTLRIPKWFADRYTRGKSLGVGFGGNFSIASSGSWGPALAVAADPDPSKNKDRSALPNVPLLGYPNDAPDRGHRDPDYTSFYDSGLRPKKPGKWNPRKGTGYWTWSDIIYGAGAWVDTPQLGGVLFIAKVGQGHVWYEHSTTHSQRGAYEWLVYDPKDLAAVATGRKKQWQIQPKHIWTDKTLPLSLLDLKGWEGNGWGQVGGVTFDPKTNRLYVLATAVWKHDTEWCPQVYVYQVK